MSDNSSGHQPAFRTTIERFLGERLDAKLEKLAPDDPKREALIAQYRYQVWIDDAARRVTQIQLVTHALKPTHPEARGTNLYKPPDALPAHAQVGSHSLGAAFADDVVGNAAALDVYKFLKLDVDGQSLLHWMLAEDAALAEALSSDPEQSKDWMAAFAGITLPRDASFASHTRAKQIYWLVRDDPADNDHYHLLAPLYSSSLAHAVYLTLDADRFGEAAKQARKARRENQEHPTGYRDYPDLAVQKLGGTKPQNISQLNSERRGDNYLLSSLPPHWRSRAIKQPWLIESVFSHRYGRREDVRVELTALRTFLRTNPAKNQDTRMRRERHIEALIDALVVFALELQSGLPADWSADARCQLVQVERLWLDPGRAESDDDFRADWLRMEWPDAIGERFGNWLNDALGKELPMGDVERREWRDELLLDHGWAQQVKRQRQRLQAPTYIPTRRRAP